MYLTFEIVKTSAIMVVLNIIFETNNISTFERFQSIFL